jgi:O-antigen/teichoic acid export membrane protein
MYFLKPYLKDLILFNVDFFRQKKIRYLILEDLKQFKHIFIFGFFISIGKISFNVMKSLDIVILKIFFDYADVGVYGVADTASGILFYMTAFSLPILSSISEAWTKKDHVLLEKYVKISVKYPLIIGIPLTVIILTLAQPIIVGIYGIDFQGAVVPLQILIIGTFLLMFGYTLSSILIGIGKPKLSGLLMAGAAAQYIFSLYVLTPALGFEGAAISLTLTGVTSLFLIPFFIKYYLKIEIFSGSLKVLFSGAILASFLFFIPKSNFLLLIFGVVAGIVIYVLLLRYTGYISPEDIDKLKDRTSAIIKNISGR